MIDILWQNGADSAHLVADLQRYDFHITFTENGISKTLTY